LWQTRFKDQRAGLAHRRIRLRDGVERADADRDGTALLFPSRRGGYLSEGEVPGGIDPAAEAIGQDGLTPHGLRHTCASLTIAAGANVKVLQTLLGHKTATLTLDRYGHLFPDDLGRIADAFDEAAESAAARCPCQGFAGRPKQRLTCGFWCPR
jgi:integrase